MINDFALTRYHAAVFKALGHPTRLQIMDLLAHGSMNTTDFCEYLEGRVSTHARHLAQLRAVGLVHSGRSANAVNHSRTIDLVDRFQEMLVRWQRDVEKKRRRRCAYY